MSNKHSNIGWHKSRSKIKRTLSPRQIEIVKLIVKGYNNLEIANELNISRGVIRNYLNIIFDKLELRNRVQVAVWYVKRDQSEKILLLSTDYSNHIGMQ